MQIVDKTYFQKPNVLNIPLSVAAPTANAALTTPNNAAYLDEVCVRIEKSILLNAFQLATYNELQLALADIDNPLYASYKKLVQGEEYDGKVWKGLDNDYSLIAFRVYEVFLAETNERLSGVGTVKANPEAAILSTPMYKIANASNAFFEGYQQGYLICPEIKYNGLFIDWMGSNDNIDVSLYQYMNDKKVDFPLFDIGKFVIYDPLGVQNSFGI